MLPRWRAVVGFEGRYEVSDQGQVRSVRSGNNFSKRLHGKPLKPRRAKAGYPTVSLYAGGKGTRKERPIHRLVLEAFAGPCPVGHEALHTDGSRTNNHLANLRWGTRSENNADRYRASGIRTTETIARMVIMAKTQSINSIAKEFGVSWATAARWIRAEGAAIHR